VLRGRVSLILRILITGASGFVGGRLAHYLAKAGHQILLGSSKLEGSPFWLPQASVLYTDWDSIENLNSICIGVDVVIHAAGMNARDCALDPVGALAFNGVATARLVDAACRACVRRFIYISTAHVYAKTLVGLITEDTHPLNPHPYATSHIAGEHALLTASQQGIMQGIVLRLSNAFGSPMYKNVNCWKLLINDLCRQAVETRTLVLDSTENQMRDFIAMNEVCRAAERLAVGNFDDHRSDIFNIGTGTTHSVLAMAKIIQSRCSEVFGFEPKLQLKKDIEDKKCVEFSYQTKHRDKLGIKFSEMNTLSEIDNLLRYCNTEFGHNYKHTL